ncbi:MAG: type II toxin-antitoxin system RelE/ParE family toxin [Bacteroidota bacterium]
MEVEMRFFNTVFLKEADEFLATLDKKTVAKVLFNIELAEHQNDRRLFKKLRNEIWEFRTLFKGNQIRLLAFWDSRDKAETLVVATHGFMKKSAKVPTDEIDKAIALRDKYFEKS